MKNFIALSALFLTCSTYAYEAHANGDAYIRDTVSDTGVEPYSGAGPVYLSPDIWVRTNPDTNYSPYPFPTNAPSWTPAAHQNPEYRDSKTGRPNYVYVRIHNRGTTATTGTERLRLYQAKAGTGLAWPASWVDNMANACGQSLLHGIEVTKPRLNWSSATPGQRTRYVNALNAITTNSAFRYSDNVQYFQKQQSVHTQGNPEHGNPAFLPWHREMMNRYEERLRESDPLVTLLYWDTTENPADIVNTGFVGPTSGTFTFGGVTLSRNMGILTNADSDATLLSSAYDEFEDFTEQLEGLNHDWGHGTIGGSMGSAGTSAQDPFFFLHHTNIDRVWATWQREDADPSRNDPVSAYDGDSSNPYILADMDPWAGNTPTQPWSGASTTTKDSKHQSVVYAPVYDTAPLNIPVMQPGESVVMEIPWYPPNVNSFNCAGDAGHFCLLARIETQTNAPFGMTFPEGTSVGTNTRNNNNIAWKNLTIVDNELEPLFFVAGTSVHNFFRDERFFDLRLVDRTAKRRFLLQELGEVALVVPKDILARIGRNKEALRDLELTEMKGIDQPVLRIVGKEPAIRFVMKPGERFNVQFAVRLRDKDMAKVLMEEPFHFDIEQELNLPERFIGLKDRNAVEVGGVRFTIDYARMVKERDRNKDGKIVLADFPITLSNRRLVESLEMQPAADPATHFSPGEPVQLNIGAASEGRMQSTRLMINGTELRRFDGDPKADEPETITFDEPGVHRIVVEGIGVDGEMVRTEKRILVSENIPPQVFAASDSAGQTVKAGETVQILARTNPAFERSIKEVTLHVKQGTSFAGGFNLVASEAYPAIARAEGVGPHSFEFKPEEPGLYMLQVGAVDDKGIVGESDHVMVRVAE